jgi:hypothetical protein
MRLRPSSYPKLAEALEQRVIERLVPVRQEGDPPNPAGVLLRARRDRPHSRRTAEQRDALAALCMSGKQHSEGRRGFGHDRLPVATGSPQALRIPNRE